VPHDVGVEVHEVAADDVAVRVADALHRLLLTSL
jgi:hypothetical protein